MPSVFVLVGGIFQHKALVFLASYNAGVARHIFEELGKNRNSFNIPPEMQYLKEE